jgi:hypothetical protein
MRKGAEDTLMLLKQLMLQLFCFIVLADQVDHAQGRRGHADAAEAADVTTVLFHCACRSVKSCARVQKTHRCC